MTWRWWMNVALLLGVCLGAWLAFITFVLLAWKAVTT